MGNYRIGSIILHASLVLWACVVLLGFNPLPSFAETSSESETYDLILEVKRDRKVISQALLGLERDEKYYVPIQTLANLFKFNAAINLDKETVSGFFISEDNSYSLDVSQNTYTLRGKSYNFNPEDVLVLTQKYGVGDIYITPDLLNKIWPLDLYLDQLKQTLEVRTQKKLPYELSLERQKNRNRRLQKNDTLRSVDDDLPKIENKYKMFSLPAIDFSSTTSIEHGKSGIGEVVNVSGRNDLLNAQADYNFSFGKMAGESLKFNNARFLLERQSYDEGDLPVGLQLAQFGDIRPKPSRLIDGSLRGRGILLSTEPQKQIVDFDQITVEGYAEPGWEVELYRGNELVDFQIVNPQGEYRFENVSLNFSNTTIKTVMYGPEGQILESEKQYNIAETMIPPNKTIFEASLLDANQNLIPTDSDPKNQPEGLAQNYKLKRGINSWLSVFSTFTNMPTKNKDRNYGTLGVNLSFLGMSGLAEVYKDLSGGKAYDFRAAGDIAGINTNLRTSIFSDFESPEANFGAAARTSRTEATFSKPFKLLMGSLGLRLQFDHQKFKAISDRTDVDFSETFAINKLRVTHGNQISMIDGDHQNTDGYINATYKITPSLQLRSLLNYDLHPEKQIRNLFSELRFRNNQKLTTALNVKYDFQDQGTQIGASAAYDFDKYKLGFNTDWKKDEGLRAFLRATFSMAPYGENGEYIYSSKNLSNRSSLNGRVFLDKNYDGEFNEGDEVIKDAHIDIGKRETSPSKANGYAQYVGSSRHQYENITLNLDSLEDPYMVSTQAGYRGLLRPATSTYVDFPVIETGVVDGTVITDDGPLANVRMQLVEDGQVIDTVSTAFDGYYIFEYVEPGSYTIRVDPSYEQLNIPPKEILVTSENLFDYQVDFQISEQAGEVSCVEEADSDGRITQNCHETSISSGNIQPVHTLSTMVNDNPTVVNLRMAKRPDYLRMVLDYDQKPNDYQIIRSAENKEITIILSAANWKVSDSWDNQTPDILKRYSIERLPDGDIKLIVRAMNTIKIRKDEVLTPAGEYGHRIYFDFIK